MIIEAYEMDNPANLYHLTYTAYTGLSTCLKMKPHTFRLKLMHAGTRSAK